MTGGGDQGVLHDWSAHSFEISIFATLSATSVQRRKLRIDELAQMIATTSAEAPGNLEAAKRRLPLLKLAIFGRHKTPIHTGPDGRRAGGSLRHDGNLEALTGIEADYDAEQIGFEDAHERLLKVGIWSVLYTSPRYTPEKPRWRVLCPFSRAIIGQEGNESTDRLLPKHSMYVSWLNGVWAPEGCFGAESWTASQSYYFGNANANPDFRVEVIDGMPLDLHSDLALRMVGKPGGAARKPGRPRLAVNNGEPVPPPPETLTPTDEAELMRLIVSGESIHPAMTQLAGKWKHLGMIPSMMMVDALLDQCEPSIKLTSRWAERKAELPEIWAFLFGKDQVRAEMRRRERKASREARAENLASAEAQTQADPALPVIEVLNGLRHVAVDHALRIMHEASVPFWQRDTALVRVASVRAKASDSSETLVPAILPVTPAMLARAMGKVATWRRTNRQGEMIRIEPPRDVVEQAASMVGEWPFQPLLGVIGTATLRPDCTVLSAPGYDAATGLFLHRPPAMPEMIARPTKDDAARALVVLDGLLQDFPFENDISRSVAMSMLMTPVVRGALAEAVPMHVCTAPTPGTGKSYLSDVSSMIAIGERQAVMTISPKPEESEKRLHAAAINGQPIISIDNCNGVLSGDFLAQVTERPRVSIRLLGSLAQVHISNTFTVFANGNNLTVAADLVRRTVRCNLDANLDDPGTRAFRGDPVALVREARGRYIDAVLTIVRAFHLAGEPYDGPVLHSFGRWSTLVAGALGWLGWNNPIGSSIGLRAEDPARQTLAMVLEAFPDGLASYSPRELLNEAEERDSWGEYVNPAWAEAAQAIARNRQGRLDTVVLGYWLRDHNGRIIGRRRLTRVGTETRPRWCVLEG